MMGTIYDMIAIDNSQLLLLIGCSGLLKATKDQAIDRYLEYKSVFSICHIADSLYFVGYLDGLIVWNAQTDQKLFQICQDRVISIKRILTTNTYIIKTDNNGLKLLTIKNLERSEFSLKHLLDLTE